MKNQIPNKNIIIDSIHDIGSVSVGLFIDHGSSNENNLNSGYSHFLEHMLFKGTKTKSSRDISYVVESVGGYINGYTTHKNIAIVAKIPKFALNSVIELFSDIILRSKFLDIDIDIEKKVVIEEINSSKDEPEDFLYESYMAEFWKKTAYNKPIAGNCDIISNINREKFVDFRNYIEDYSRVISISGNIDYLGDQEILSQIVNVPDSLNKTPKESYEFVVENKFVDFSTVQSHNLLGTMIQIDNSLYNKMLLSFINSVFIDGMSSMFFQLLREQHGLVYDIYPIIEDFGDVINYSIYFSSKLENRDSVIDKIFNLYDDVFKRGFSKDEFDYFQGFYKGNLLLSLENSYTRMALNAKDYLKYDRLYSIDDRFDLLNRLNLDDINEFFRKNFKREKFSIYGLVPRN